MLELRHVDLPEAYRKKWNVYMKDFCHLYKDGVKVSDTLYRIGGFGLNFKEDYNMILKHIESFYDDNITTVKSKKPHLKDLWTIIDKNGVEKVVFEQFTNVYLSGGQIYILKNKF